MKHFFHADRVHFVLVTNRDYLIRSVEKRYGLSDASSDHLQKYYDFVIHFETVGESYRGTDAAIYAQHLLQKILPRHVPGHDATSIKDCTVAIATAFNLTLRQTERIVTNVAMAYLAIRENEFRPAAAICFLAALKALRPDIYTSIKHRRFDYPTFLKWTGTVDWGSFPIARMRVWFEYFGSRDADMADKKFEASVKVQAPSTSPTA